MNYYMIEDVTHVQVFKTNINSPEDKLRVIQLLKSNDSIEEANLDLEDVDRVLRIVCSELVPQQIINTLSDLGFNCQELD